MMGCRLRQLMGVALFDLPRFMRHVWRRGGWVNITNRKERVTVPEAGCGLAIDSPWSSDLHACRVVPWLGKAVMRAALRQWPVQFATQAARSGPVDLSFVIPHRGAERLPLLKAVLRSILGQDGVSVECVVAEQGPERSVSDLPAGTRHIDLTGGTDAERWKKARAFNEGVLAASGRIVVCHDGDILVPKDYGREVLQRMESEDTEVVYAQRFLFYLSHEDTSAVVRDGRLQRGITPTRVNQNWRGGTLAIRKDAYFRIGGFDERFTGWTGEDVEFYDRCLVLGGWRFGYLPFIHLWHAPQETKFSQARETSLQFTDKVMSTPREQRVRELVDRQGLCASLEPEAYFDHSTSSQR